MSSIIHFFLTIQKKILIKFFLKNQRNDWRKNFFKKSCDFLEKNLRQEKLLLQIVVRVFEIAALLIDVKPGDQIIMPSYTFVSTANAFVLRGGKPVFVDIRKDNLNIDEKLIEKKITKKTKAIVVVHYAGVPCNMDKIVKIGKKYNLFIIEDAAQAIFSKYKNKYCGTLGDIGCLSFHETKNITSCEGGAIILNKKVLIEKPVSFATKEPTENILIKSLKKYYSWFGLGSSYIPSEITCSILYSQLLNYKKILKEREKIWKNYSLFFKRIKTHLIETKETFSNKIKINHHMFYIICKNYNVREKILSKLKKENIFSTFHYIPLHKSIMGYEYYRGKLSVTESLNKEL